MNATAHDVLSVHGLRTVAVVGALAHERDAPQPLEIDLDVYGNFATAANSDDLADAVNYATLIELAVQVSQRTAARLLERLAVEVADAVLAVGGVAGVTVRVAKLRPPVPHDVNRASVSVTRWAS